MSSTRLGGGRAPNGRLSFSASSSFWDPSALLVLLAVLGVACEDEIVIVELSQLAVKTLVSLKFLGRRKDAATLGALQEGEMRIH